MDMLMSTFFFKTSEKDLIELFAYLLLIFLVDLKCITLLLIDKKAPTIM